MCITQIVYRGEKVDLRHLAPMVFRCPCPHIGRDIVIGVNFRNHCYTVRFDPNLHTIDDICLYEAPGRPRVFSPERHSLSFDLPARINELPVSKVHQTSAARNYVYSVPIISDGRLYETYFMLQRHRKDGADLRLTVESAYPVTSPSLLRARPNAIRFSVLALKVLKNQPVRFGAR